MIVRLAAALALLTALPAAAQTPAPVQTSPPAQIPAPVQTSAMLDCTGPFGKAGDEEALVKRFGRANVTSADLDGAEGATERGTVLFAKDPARRIEIFWHDTAKRRRPASIVVRGTSGWNVRAPGNPGPTVALRTSLDGVENANERPFSLNGFAWDMGGYSTGWKGGKLANMEGGCTLSVRFDPNPKVKGRPLDRVSGEKQFGSSDPAIKAVRPAVSQLSLDWPE